MHRTNWPHPNGQNWVLFYFPGSEKKAEKIAQFNLGQYDSDIENPKASDSLKGKVISKLTRALKK